MEKKYQYGEGCLSDQLLGQWLGMVSGLGRYLPQERIRSALGAIYKYNFRPDFRNFSNVQRTYALADEKGLLLCSWPKGGRPPLPFPYSDEVWTGIEYQVASHLIYEGLVEEGLSVVKAARDRYDGRRRNPWDEVECGHHYARAMSSWGVLLALSGFSYSGPDMKMGFDPKVAAEDFRTVWTAGPGWGTYAQKISDGKAAELKVEVKSGGLTLREFVFTAPASFQAIKVKSLRGSLGTTVTKPSFKKAGSIVRILWGKPIVVKPGEPLALELQF
jgi:hypothetical protein